MQAPTPEYCRQSHAPWILALTILLHAEGPTIAKTVAVEAPIEKRRIVEGPSGNVVPDLERRTLRDTEAKIAALDLLLPRDWTLAGGVTWNANPAFLTTLKLAARSKNGNVVLEFLRPTSVGHFDAWVYFSDASGAQPISLEGGPFQSPTDYVQKILWPRLRARTGEPIITATERLRGVEQALLRDLPSASIPSFQLVAERSRFEYDLDGVRMEEDVYCVLADWKFEPSSRQWITERVYSFRAPKGQLEPAVPLLKKIVGSIRLQKDWARLLLAVQRKAANPGHSPPWPRRPRMPTEEEVAKFTTSTKAAWRVFDAAAESPTPDN